MSKIFDNPDYWFAGTPKKTKKSSSSAGIPSVTSSRSNYNSKQTTFNNIKAFNKKAPQAVVKISGASKGVNRAQAHIDYIGRNGKVEIEDQDGNKYNNKNEQKSLMGAWQAQGCTTNTKQAHAKKRFTLSFQCQKVQMPKR